MLVKVKDITKKYGVDNLDFESYLRTRGFQVEERFTGMCIEDSIGEKYIKSYILINKKAEENGIPFGKLDSYIRRIEGASFKIFFENIDEQKLDNYISQFYKVEKDKKIARQQEIEETNKRLGREGIVCYLQGCRGRSIEVYKNKCVITTDVTLGSVLTANALDGEKTIFYKDVVGVQFKKSGITIGYLQLETAAQQMNNLSSNMFSENTFTFDNEIDIMNDIMVEVKKYILSRIEGYKYDTIYESPEKLPEDVEKMIESL